MKKIILSLFVLSFLSGCTTTEAPDPLLEAYKTVVLNDGVTQEEAVVIAKKNAKDKNPPESFSIDLPTIHSEFESVPHQEDFWFVSFPEIEKSAVPVIYMVVIRKENGKIVFSRSYATENEWVLEAALLKLYEKQ